MTDWNYFEWPSLAPQLHDCFEIHNFHWGPCDLLLSSHQNFQHEIWFHHCVCTGPLWFLVLCTNPHFSWMWVEDTSRGRFSRCVFFFDFWLVWERLWFLLFYHLFNMRTWHRHRRGINSTLILCSNFPVAWCCRDWRRRRTWGWCGMMTLLSCGVIEVERWELEEELVNKSGTTIGTKFSVLHFIRIPFPMRWFWPLIHSHEHPCSSQSFPSDETAGVPSRTFIVKNIVSSLTGYDYRRTVWFRQSVHFSITQVFFADHVHRRSGVDNKFSFLRFKSRCRHTPIFRRWMLLCLFSILLHGHLALATLSPPETAPQILERWDYTEVHLGKYFRAKDFGLEF